MDKAIQSMEKIEKELWTNSRSRARSLKPPMSSLNGLRSIPKSPKGGTPWNAATKPTKGSGSCSVVLAAMWHEHHVQPVLRAATQASQGGSIETVSDERLREYAERLMLLDWTDWHTQIEAAVKILKELLREAQHGHV